MKRWIFACLLSFLPLAAHAGLIRIKDLVEFDGVRGNDLVGYGLVVGLNGTGDGLRNSPFTEEIMSNLLERLGSNVTGENFSPKNVAAVFVTASLPPFARAGGQIAVSYTHLDVYKRQALHNAELRGGVDTDQEMQNLLMIEQAYSANAKVIQNVDDMIKTLLSI